MLMVDGWLNKKSIYFIFGATIIFIVALLLLPQIIMAKAKENINNFVHFTPQAPIGEWSDSRQQDGCEEAVSLMAVSWFYNIPNFSPLMWREKIITLSDFEQEKYGEYRDASLSDIEKRIFNDYFYFYDLNIKKISSTKDILNELESGNIVLAPADGRLLHNPNFTSPGPEHHMILIKGYDYEKELFITNDPGTRNGKDYIYSEDVLYEAIQTYETGYHE